MTTSDPSRRTLEVGVAQDGLSTGMGTARTHSLLIDRPIAKGGADRGPLGGELLLLSLGGCFLSTLLAAVRTRGAAVSDVKVVVVGTIGGAPERFEAIEMRVSANFADGELMRKLLDIAERGCLVTNTLKRALEITVTIEKAQGTGPRAQGGLT
jgi:putative redox protein